MAGAPCAAAHYTAAARDLAAGAQAPPLAGRASPSIKIAVPGRSPQRVGHRTKHGGLYIPPVQHMRLRWSRRSQADVRASMVGGSQGDGTFSQARFRAQRRPVGSYATPL